MKSIAAVLLLFAAFGEPKTYPLRLRIVKIEERSDVRYDYSRGHGIANLREEDGTLHGIEYEFEGCDKGFKASVGPLWYEARLKKEFKLGVAKRELGSDKMNECEFNYTPHDFRYHIKNGQVETLPAIKVPLGAETD